jgi:hypothetical protein
VALPESDVSKIIMLQATGKHVNLPDLERKDVANANSSDPKFTGPLIRGHSALGLEM